MKRHFQAKTALTAALAINVAMLCPMAAFADGVLKLRPMQKDNAPKAEQAYSSPNANSTSGGSNAYDSYYNNPSLYNNPTVGNAAGVNGTGYSAPATDDNNAAGYTNDENALRGRLVSLPKGTLMSVHLDHAVTASTSHIGDPITATLENDVYSSDAVAIPAGSQVVGQVTSVNQPGHLGKHGELDVRFDTLKLADGRVLTIPAHIVTQDQSGTLKGDTYGKDVLKGTGIAAGGAALGTVGGLAAGGLIGAAGAGALFGLGIGALGGLGYAAARKGKDVVLTPGSRMSLMVDSPITFNN